MNKKKVLSWLLFISWLLLIFFFSNQTGESSSGLSNGVFKMIENIVHIPLDSELYPFLIRKLAHFTEYLILGILTLNLVQNYLNIEPKQLIFLVLFCFCYACSDEFHQIFISGRSPQVFDVLIDTIGSLMGIMVYHIWRTRKKTSKKNTVVI